VGLGKWRNCALAVILAAGTLAGPATSVLAQSGSPPVVSLSASPNPALSDYTNVYISGHGTYDRGCGIRRYLFNFGDGSTTSTTYAYAYHYYHTSLSSETFTIKLTVKDRCGSRSSAQIAEVVNQDQPPIPSLKITHSSSDPYKVHADASGTADTDQTTPWEFDFNWGDKTADTTTYAPQEFASHTYSLAGPYTVAVTVFDFAFNQGTTTQAVTVPIATQPGAPSNVVATAGDTAATVSWSAPTSGGTPNSYTATASPGGASATVGGTASQATVTGLSNGTTYSFTVTATSGGGSATSQFSNPVTPIGLPAQPTSVTATPDNSAAVVSWSAPTSGGTSSPGSHRQLPTRYTITAAPGGAQVTVWGSPPPTNTTIAGLTNSTSYTFTVTASNAVGSGPSSGASNPVSPSSQGPTITMQPHWKLVEPSTVGTSPNSLPLPVTVVWAGQAGSAAICSYSLQVSRNNGPWTDIALTSPTDTTASDTIPKRLDLVRYQVQATDCNGVPSAWAQSAEFSYSLLEESRNQFSFSPGWTRTACSSCARGYDETTTVSGAIATLTLHAAYNVGLVFAVGPTLGSADISVDGTFKQTVDTNAPTSGYRQLLFKVGWSVFGVHTIQVKSLATNGQTGIALDGAAVLFAPLFRLSQ
jgi:hypothetical protein